MDVEAWLRELGLEQYVAAFADNDIDAETLPSLTADDLRELGVASLGHRKKLLAAVAALQTASAPPPSDMSESMADAEGEQREVTVLFADLSSFTRLSADLGAEHTHALLNQYFDAADTVVAAYGGAIDKHIGDSVMGVFGAPIAHSNDPERAVRAALEIQQATTRLGERFGRNLQVHIGIANGQVVASGTGSDTHRQYTVIGDSVNVAARLQDLAGPSEIWISDRVYRSVRVDLECESLGGVEVKGLDAPVVAWRVQALHDGMPAQAPSKLVGRRNELNQFRGIVRACLDTGQGQAIYVRGETGIGKTRLVSEFGTIAAAEGFGCHNVLVLDFGVGKGQDPIRSIVRSLLGIPAGSGAAVDQAAVDQAIETGRLHADQRPYLNDLLDLPQPGELRVLYDAMTETVRRQSKHRLVVDLIKTLSAQAPLLLAVDNVHWADSITLDYLAAITVVVRACPAVLVMTSRIDDDPLDAAWRSSVQGAALMTIDLGPLQKDEAMALAGTFVDRAHRFALECVERAEGNPLFLEQLLRNAEESEAREIPASIHSLVLARVDRLPAEDKRALQAAAVIGQRFSLDMLRALLDLPGYDATRLMQHYLVRPEGEEYLFTHALIQEGVYASLLTARRHALHGRAAQWCAERDPILRARHLDRAEDALAPQVYLQAAHIQAANFRDLPALGLVERGLEIASTRIDQLALTTLQGRLLHDLGRSPDSVEAYQRALDLADDDNQRCGIWIGLAAAMRIVDRLDEALDVLDRAETVATREYLLTELARVHHLRGNVYFPLGRIEECHEEHQMALDYARQAGSRELEAQALSGLADANSLRARINTAHNHFHHAIVIARANGFGRIEVANRHMRGIMRYYQNDLLGAAEDCLAGAEGATKVAHQRAEMVARAACGYVLTELGDFTEARAQCEQALDLARRLGAGRFESSTLRHLGRVLAAEGKIDAALELFEQSYAIAKDAGLAFSGPWALGSIAVYTADAEARRRALAEGEAILAEGCPFHNYFWFYRDGMEACLDSGAWDEVERYAAALEAFTRAEPVPWTTFFIERGRALATMGRGGPDGQVLDQLERLRAEAERAGFKLVLPGLESALADMRIASAGD